MAILDKGAIVRQVINGVTINDSVYEVIDYDSASEIYKVVLLKEEIENNTDASENLIREDVSLIRTGIVSRFNADSIKPVDYQN